MLSLASRTLRSVMAAMNNDEQIKGRPLARRRDSNVALIGRLVVITVRSNSGGVEDMLTLDKGRFTIRQTVGCRIKHVWIVSRRGLNAWRRSTEKRRSKPLNGADVVLSMRLRTDPTVRQ
ncbi:MAG: hypothetical protein GPOALKHO_000458 [Sodalis sp.]|nr:MAG: hypothetical protein GPOALKHO_000458 [Sodalis sp.]